METFKIDSKNKNIVKVIEVVHGLEVMVSKNILLSYFDSGILYRFELRIRSCSIDENFAYVKFINRDREDELNNSVEEYKTDTIYLNKDIYKVETIFGGNLKLFKGKIINVEKDDIFKLGISFVRDDGLVIKIMEEDIKSIEKCL